MIRLESGGSDRTLEAGFRENSVYSTYTRDASREVRSFSSPPTLRAGIPRGRCRRAAPRLHQCVMKSLPQILFPWKDESVQPVVLLADTGERSARRENTGFADTDPDIETKVPNRCVSVGSG
jgi:hypothetical protein